MMLIYSFKKSIDEKVITAYLILQTTFIEYVIFMHAPSVRKPLIFLRIFTFNNAMVLLRNLPNVLLILGY
jgi:hypothetical protein